MTIPYPEDPSEQTLSKALAKKNFGFVGVLGGVTNAQRRIPIRLQLNQPDFILADSTVINKNTTRQLVYVGNGEDGKRPSEHGMPLLPPAAPEACPFAPDGHCSPYNYLNITLGNEEVGHLAFLPSLNRLQTLPLKRRSFQVISGKRLACLPIEIRLRGKPARQHAGRPIYYVDLTLRSGTTLEKTLANARGTASRWFRADRPRQGCLTRLRPRRRRTQQR
jgi:hypothetical protein